MPRAVKKLLSGFLKSLLSVQREHQHPHLPRAGHIWVRVGKGPTPTRFELDAIFLNHPLFEDLLRLSEDEFGYSYDGALRIPCDADLFLRVFGLLGSSDPAVHSMEVANLVTSSGDTSIHRRDPHALKWLLRT
ncbi:hypothetical protein Taro_048809 [Colocasia esculenta]|uniref:Uncharacterized protein n=1 Tax=Colocasia esculenta TaxID=4460 RepID=A0A843X936_COLES|nr:hypothetical protein [Colocasia esculenta]